MSDSAPQSSNSLRNFVLGVLATAALLGVYFVQLNAKVDRQREEAAEQLALCLHLERVAGAAASANLELGEACKQLNESEAKRTKVQ